LPLNIYYSEKEKNLFEKPPLEKFVKMLLNIRPIKKTIKRDYFLKKFPLEGI